jgi:hypothetical protein
MLSSSRSTKRFVWSFLLSLYPYRVPGSFNSFHHGVLYNQEGYNCSFKQHCRRQKHNSAVIVYVLLVARIDDACLVTYDSWRILMIQIYDLDS